MLMKLLMKVYEVPTGKKGELFKMGQDERKAAEQGHADLTHHPLTYNPPYHGVKWQLSREKICICSWSWFSIQSLSSSNFAQI